MCVRHRVFQISQMIHIAKATMKVSVFLWYTLKAYCISSMQLSMSPNLIIINLGLHTRTNRVFKNLNAKSSPVFVLLNEPQT